MCPGPFDDVMQQKPLVSKHAAPDHLGRDMVVHCAMEMNHLAGFLPELYADYHPETSLGNRESE